MNIKQCTYLLAIAEFGYLSHAAAYLDISQAALSKFLSEQERQLGVTLFVRYKKQLYPTPAGKIYLDAAQQMVSAKNNILISLRQFSTDSAFTIRAISTPHRGAEAFSRVYPKFMSFYPHINLKLEEEYSAMQELMIHNNSADFACGSSRHADYPDICNIPITREEVFLTVPSFHMLAKYASKDIEHPVSIPLRVFRDSPFVLPSDKSNIRLIANELFARNNFSPIIAYESTNTIAVDSMIKVGLGIGFTTHRYLRADSGMVYFRLDPPCQEITYLRYRKGHVFTKEELVFCGLVIQERITQPYNYLIEGEEVALFMDAVKLIRETEDTHET